MLASFNLQLLERVAELGKLVAVDRVQAAEDHRLRVAVARERRRRRARPASVTVSPDRALADVLDAGDQVADLARAELGRPASVRASGSPISSISFTALACMNSRLAPSTRIAPSTTRTELTTPRYWS